MNASGHVLSKESRACVIKKRARWNLTCFWYLENKLTEELSRLSFNSDVGQRKRVKSVEIGMRLTSR